MPPLQPTRPLPLPRLRQTQRSRAVTSESRNSWRPWRNEPPKRRHSRPALTKWQRPDLRRLRLPRRRPTPQPKWPKLLPRPQAAKHPLRNNARKTPGPHWPKLSPMGTPQNNNSSLPIRCWKNSNRRSKPFRARRLPPKSSLMLPVLSGMQPKPESPKPMPERTLLVKTRRLRQPGPKIPRIRSATSARNWPTPAIPLNRPNKPSSKSAPLSRWPSKPHKPHNKRHKRHKPWLRRRVLRSRLPRPMPTEPAKRTKPLPARSHRCRVPSIQPTKRLTLPETRRKNSPSNTNEHSPT